MLLLSTRPASAATSEAAQANIEGVVQAMRLQDENNDGRRDSRTTHNGDASTSGRPEPDPQQQVCSQVKFNAMTIPVTCDLLLAWTLAGLLTVHVQLIALCITLTKLCALSGLQRRRRPLSEYKPDSDLARALAEASVQDSADKGGKPRLHLVVLGHVDAGKSTLMGRLLHELG